MALTKVSYSMIGGAVKNVVDFGAVSDQAFTLPTELLSDAVIYIPDGFTLRLEPTTTYDISNVTFFSNGQGKIVSNMSTTPIFNISGNVVFDSLTIEDSGEFIRSTSGFNSLIVKNCFCRDFGRFAYITGSTQNTVRFEGNHFIGQNGWGIDTEARDRAAAVYYTTQTLSFGDAYFVDNKVFNLVTETDKRADAFLTRVRNMVATGNIIQNVISNREEYIDDGYIDFSDDTSSTGIYSSSSNTVITGNILRNAGRVAITTTSIDKLVCSSNQILFDISTVPSGTPTNGGDYWQWQAVGLYTRAINAIVGDNEFTNIPLDIASITSTAFETDPRRYVKINNNTFIKNDIDSRGFGCMSGKNIYARYPAKNFVVTDNLFSGLDETNPATLDFGGGRRANLFVLASKDLASTGIVFSDNMTERVNVTTGGLRAALVITDDGSGGETVSQVEFVDNTYTASGSGDFLYGFDTPVDLDRVRIGGWISDGPNAFNYSRPNSFTAVSVDNVSDGNRVNNRYVNNSVDVTITSGNTSSNFSWPVGPFGGRVSPPTSSITIVPETDIGSAKHFWLTNLDESGGTINLDADPVATVSFRVGFDISELWVDSI